MGVQYQGATEATSSSRFSMSSKREADLVLRPTKEGIDFTLRLLQANRMSKVVEVHCDFEDDDNNKHALSQLDVRNLMEALSGSVEDDHDSNEDDDMEDVDMVTEEYTPSKSKSTTIYKGLPQMESLAIICDHASADTPSFLAGLTYFVSASFHNLHRFTRLTLEGVNLRGTALELRGLAECFRMHPRMHHVQMTACLFTDEQQANMGNTLESAFQEQRQRTSSARFSIAASSEHSATATATSNTSNGGLRQRNNTKKSKKSQETEQDDDGEGDNKKEWWGKRLLRKCCFCWCCP